MEEEYKYMVCTRCFTFNHAPYIVDAMNGFAMQETTFPVVTVIVDDASTDGEQDVIRKYLDEHFQEPYRTEETDYAHIVCANHKTNPNCQFIVLFMKFNHHSIRTPKTPYLKEWLDNAKYHALCEGDDYWIDTQKLQMQVDILQKNPNCSFCVTDYKEYNEYIKDFQPHQLKINKHIKDDYIYASIADYIYQGFFTKTLTAMYRPKALKQSNYYIYQLRYDMPMFYALFTQGDCVFINKKMGVYRLSDAGVTSPIHREKFIDTQLPRLFSIIQVEKTKEAQLFIYTFLKRYIVYVLYKHQFDIIRKCFSLFSLKLNMKLFLYELPKQVLIIIKNKMQHKSTD